MTNTVYLINTDMLNSTTLSTILGAYTSDAIHVDNCAYGKGYYTHNCDDLDYFKKFRANISAANNVRNQLLTILV
jgi:hypothetical protein